MSSHKAQFEVGACSETGYVRNENQDRMSGTRVPLGQLYIVADGMGGHKGGALAAELTVQGLQQCLEETPAQRPVEEAIQTAFTKTNETVYHKAHAGDPATEGMGSTAVLLLISEQAARVAHVGDSRAYLYRRGRLKRLTTDHTVVQKMVQAGMLKPEEAIDHPNASVLERAIGIDQSVEAEISDTIRLKQGDALLLCSDGLCGYVADAEIVSVLRSQATVQEVPEHLVRLALQKGGEDNVTVQFIQYGTRKEAHRGKVQEQGGRVLVSALKLKRLRPSLQTLGSFVLGIAISAAVFYQVSRTNRISFENTETRLSAELENKQEDLDDIKKQLQLVQSDLKSTVEKANEQIEGLEENLKESEKARDDSTKQLNNTQGQLGTSKKELQTTRTTLATTRKELQTLKKQLADSQKELQTTKTTLATTQKELQTVKEQLAATRQELQTTKEQLDTARAQGGSSEAGEPAGTSEPKKTPQ
jgi:serine/threonine protein phosphatase PrpC